MTQGDNWSLIKTIMSRKAIYSLIIFAILLGGYRYWKSLSTPQSLDINQINSSTLPLTGTFLIPDLFYPDNDTVSYDTTFKEMRELNMNTVILGLTGHLTKDCKTNRFIEEPSYSRLNQQMINLINSATKYQMEIYFETGTVSVVPCLVYYEGKTGNEATDKGKVIAFSERTITAINALISDRSKIPTPPNVAGYYIPIEEGTDRLSRPIAYNPYLPFYADISKMIKTKTGKKILLSPFQREDTNYTDSKIAFDNLYSSTSIDIISPQDSIGTNVTKTTTSSSAHFQALSDSVAAYPSKQAWANIETFGAGKTGDTFVQYQPATIDRIQGQITAANKPNISKMITYMYSHTMMINPSSYDLTKTNPTKAIYAPQYTPDNAAKRAKLRTDYLAVYGGGTVPTPTPSLTPAPSPSAGATSCNQLYYYNKNTKLCVATSDTYDAKQNNCGSTGNTCSYNINYFLPDVTTGVCYSSSESCRDSNIVSTPSPTSTPTPTASSGTAKKSDLNKDGKVNTLDYNLFIEKYGQKGNPGFAYADVNHDGKVDLKDYNILVSEYGK